MPAGAGRWRDGSGPAADPVRGRALRGRHPRRRRGFLRPRARVPRGHARRIGRIARQRELALPARHPRGGRPPDDATAARMRSAGRRRGRCRSRRSRWGRLERPRARERPATVASRAAPRAGVRGWAAVRCGRRARFRKAIAEAAAEIDRAQRLLDAPERFGAAEEEGAGPRQPAGGFGDDLGLQLLAKVDQDVAQQDEVEARLGQPVRQAREVHLLVVDPGAQARIELVERALAGERSGEHLRRELPPRRARRRSRAGRGRAPPGRDRWRGSSSPSRRGAASRRAPGRASPALRQRRRPRSSSAGAGCPTGRGRARGAAGRECAPIAWARGRRSTP